MKKLSVEEIRGVLATDGPTRYSHFVRQVADWREVWGIREPEGWVSVSDETGVPMFPVWPHEEYARLVAPQFAENATPEPIDLDDWLDGWLPDLAARGDKVAVFQTPHGKGVVVDPERLLEDIETELARLE